MPTFSEIVNFEYGMPEVDRDIPPEYLRLENSLFLN